jgi:hypothetical protein
MSFKSENEAPVLGQDQANNFFNDETSVSLFSELAKDSTTDKKIEEEEKAPEIPSTISDAIDEQQTEVITDKKPKVTPTTTESKSLELPKEWQEALEKEFNSENPSLIGWVDDNDKFIVPKTFGELKSLIEENKKHEVEENKKKWETDSTSDLSPQVKSIMEYAKNGGKDVTPLLEAWSTVESISSLDPNNPSDAEDLVRYNLESRGLEEDEINEQVELLKSSNKIVAKAIDLKPKLERLETERIAQMEEQQKLRQRELQENKVKYQNNMSKAIDTTFTDKNISSIVKKSILEPTYESSFRPGLKVTGFQKSLEDLQLDPTKNVHFAEVALLATDRAKFFELFGKEIKKEVTADTIKKLKFSKNTTQNTEEEVNLHQPAKLKGFRPTWKD